MEGAETSDVPKTPKKRGRKPKRKEIITRTSYSPVTRSKVAPDWTTKEALILVNEIAAVEGDCLKVLSSYQKWKIIVENCSILDVCRTANQCRNQWNSLLADYNRIKQWDSKTNESDSFWLLDPQNRSQLQLPEDFDHDLFRAIDDYVRPQMDDPDDADPKAEADLLHDIAVLGSKRHKQRPMSLKIQAEEISHNHCTIDQHQIINTGNEPPQSYKEDNLQICHEKEKHPTDHKEEESQKGLMEEKSTEPCRIGSPEQTHIAEKTRDSLLEENLENVCTDKKKIGGLESEELMQPGVEGNLPQVGKIGDSKQQSPVVEKPKIIRQRKKKREEVMVEKLRGTAEMIHAIVQGSDLAENAGSGGGSKETQTDMIRHQGDKLIACLGEIVYILDQFPFLVGPTA